MASSVRKPRADATAGYFWLGLGLGAGRNVGNSTCGDGDLVVAISDTDNAASGEGDDAAAPSANPNEGDGDDEGDGDGDGDGDSAAGERGLTGPSLARTGTHSWAHVTPCSKPIRRLDDAHAQCRLLGLGSCSLACGFYW